MKIRAALTILHCLLGLTCLFGARAAHAASLAGSLIRDATGADEFLLKVDEMSRGVAIRAERDVLEILRRLRNGSFIAGTGEFRDNAIYLSSVQTVGLRELLGAWKSTNHEIFEFRDFKTLARYRISKAGATSKLDRMGALTYVLTPDKGTSYSIFMIDSKHTVFTGTLEIASGTPRVTIHLYDSLSGIENQKISLSPVFLK